MHRAVQEANGVKRETALGKLTLSETLGPNVFGIQNFSNFRRVVHTLNYVNNSPSEIRESWEAF